MDLMSFKYSTIQDFPKPGVRFIDFSTTLTDPESFQFVVDQLTMKVKSKDFDYIIAPEARGFIWGATLSYTTGLPLILARKKGKLPRVGASVDYPTEYSFDTLEVPEVDLTGKKVVFVDDVFATGGTYNACKKLVADLGGTLTNAVVLYNVGIVDNKEVRSLLRGAKYE